MNDGIDGKGKPGRPGPIREIDIYSTPEGARAVGNPVRRAILAALRQREHSFDEIVTLAGRAKSTVSVPPGTGSGGCDRVPNRPG